MPTFRCPYCKKSLGAEPLSHCPGCGKLIVVPGHLRKTTLKDRNKMREKIERNAARQRRSLLNNDIRPGRNPVIIGLMLMVLVVVGGLVVGQANMGAKFAKMPTKEMKAAKELKALRIAIERFKVDCGRYPTEEEGLKSLVLNPGITNWGGHYVNIIKPDPWHTHYVYQLTNETVTLLSAGPDRHRATGDDILPQTPTEDEVRRKDD